MEWIDRLAETLAQEPLTAEETSTLLATARSVAHRVERRITPLSAFLLGCAVGQGLQDGTATRAELIRETVRQLEALLPAESPNGPTG
jgi:hypothetical protein